ncbi:MAG: ABC transporter substrate binding protein [Acidobacteriota bacterium]
MKRRFRVALSAAFLMFFFALTTAASGVFMVTRNGVKAFDEAKNGFLQMAYAYQIPNFNPAAVVLDGSSADDAKIQALKAKAPDLVFTVGAYATQKVRSAMPDVWVVYAEVYYPQIEGFDKDSKMIGVASLGPPQRLFNFVKELDRRARKNWVLLHSSAVQAAVPAIISKFSNAGINLTAASVPDASHLAGVFNGVRQDAGAILILPDPITMNPDALRFLISESIKDGTPLITLNESLVASGALCGAFYPPDQVGNTAAKVAEEILKGSPPQQTMIDPEKFNTAVNMITAKALKIKIPKDVNVGNTYE